MRYPVAVFSFITGKIRYETDLNGKIILTHLQKYSHFGFMLNIFKSWWPITFHFWLMFKLQEGSDEIGWVPGTEAGIYSRTPGFRFDYDLGYKKTMGYFGFHLD